jgi:hypothetical protein
MFGLEPQTQPQSEGQSDEDHTAQTVSAYNQLMRDHMAVAPLTPDAIVVYNRMDWMIVDARTSQESISTFF